MQRNKNTNHHSGFSLVEVMIALGIFTTGLIVLMGMLPQNLDRMREASSKSMERRIAQNIIGELMLNDWDKIHLFGSRDGSLRYYDTQGIELPDFTIEAIFTARVKVIPRDVNLDQDRSLESVGSSDSLSYALPDDERIQEATSQHARRIVVEVTDVASEDFDFDDPENESQILRVGAVIANLNDIQVN